MYLSVCKYISAYEYLSVCLSWTCRCVPVVDHLVDGEEDVVEVLDDLLVPDGRTGDVDVDVDEDEDEDVVVIVVIVKYKCIFQKRIEQIIIKETK